MIKRLAGWFCAIAAAVVLITIAVANRHSVKLVLDPFNPQDPVLALYAPFFFYLFVTLIAGVIVGGIATWMSQGFWRRMARARAQEAARWRAEAERLARERDQGIGKQLAIAGR